MNVYGEVHVHTAETLPVAGKSSPEMTLIKRGVKLRDKCCQVCGEKEKPLQVHHIMPSSRYPALEADTSNMITLCQSCHKKYHNQYKGAEGAVSFAKYIRDNGGGM